MDGDTLIDEVNEARKTELSRLGSSKSLYADTEGEMEPDGVLSAMADSTHHAASLLADWADATDQETFDDAAARERAIHDAIVDEFGSHEPGPRPATVDAMADAGETPARLGALVGWTLVAERKASQTTGFFTGQAKPQVASTFRGFGDEYEQTREEAVDALDAVCEETDWEDATAAALAAVGAAYDDYVETLESLGINPKPVC
ncbi:MAG: rubrerythrin family protein [Halovenus sp.]